MSKLELNPEQRLAVEHGEGPLLVIAGPGSGKTRVITERIVHLLQGAGDPADGPSNSGALRPDHILALTFTEKAAAEMKRRVSEALPRLSALPQVSTFHAFCYQVLRERHFDRQLLDEVDVWIFLRRRIGELGLEFYHKLAEPGAFLHDLNEFFSRCQDELIEPEDFETYVQSMQKASSARAASLDAGEPKLEQEDFQKKRELARVFRVSRKLIEQAGCSSLGSLISETVRLWDREPELLASIRVRFRYILVDEFQDTNFAQVELLRRLVAAPRNVTAVGDDDQAIYRFRGAAHGAFEMFETAFRGAQKIYLRRNYRSRPGILRSAGAVISKNQRYQARPALEPRKSEGGQVFLLEAPDYGSEAAWIAEEIERLASRGTSFGDVAVLYRAHTHREPLVAEFRRRQIPFAIRGLSILAAPVVRDVVAYLKLVHSPHDNISLTRVLLAPRWKFPEDLAFEVRNQALKDRCSLFSALGVMEQALFPEELDRTRWRELKEFLQHLKETARHCPVPALFDRLTERLGLRFLPGKGNQGLLEAFRSFLEQWETKSETRGLDEFMEYFQYFCEAGGQIEAPEQTHAANAVQMMTVHAAKGLEFPVVFVVSVAPQRFPHREQKPVIEFPDALRKGPEPPPDIHLQEERRLFYVAMTRAEERLYISSVVKPGRRPSVFVDDLVSNAVVRGRDVERIQVPDISRTVSSGPQTASPRVVIAERVPAEAGQLDLFDAAASIDVLTDLTGWLDRQPTITPDGRLKLSATAIEDYLACPLKFKLAHLLKIPAGPQGPLTFGSIMHRSVRYYFELRRKLPPRFEDVQEFYLRAWRDAGFEDSYQEQTYKRAGLEQLRQFVDAQPERAAGADEIRMEEHFELDLGDVMLEGRIDQIRPLATNGGLTGQGFELVDYKTGKPRTQQDADRSLQLSIYALAARRVLKLEPARLTFYNLTDNQAVSTARTSRDLEKAVDEIRAVAQQVRRLMFSPAPGFVCKRCNFVPLCPAHEEMF